MQGRKVAMGDEKAVTLPNVILIEWAKPTIEGSAPLGANKDETGRLFIHKGNIPARDDIVLSLRN